MKKRVRIGRILAAAVLLGLTRRAIAADNRITLAGHVLPQLRDATKLEHAHADEFVQLGLVVKIDETLMQQTLNQLYGPFSFGPKHFLSASEFAQTFGLADKRQALKDFAQANGFALDADDQPESMIVNVSGSVDVVEKAFNIKLNYYHSPNGRRFRANDADPMVPAALAPHLNGVVGLSNIQGLWHPHLRRGPVTLRLGAASPSGINDLAASPRFSGTGPGNTLAPADIKSIYGLNSVALTGAGQTVAVFELDGYDPVDIANYETLFSLPHVPVTFIGVDGTTNLCGGKSCSAQDPTVDTDMQEVALDIEMVIALAPGAANILVYDGPNTGTGILHNYDKIAADNTAKVISTSWGLDEQSSGLAFVQQEAPIFQRMAAQGQTIYAASGDDGAYGGGGKTTLLVDDPASQPYVTGVGGTSLSGTIASPTETVWNNGFSGGSFSAGGGGVSMFWSIPSYQTGVSGAVSPQFRNVPDVALNADPDSGYAIVVGGSIFQEGGTSAAAPLWAGMTALINQQRAGAGKGAFGFANPTLYQLAVSTSATVYTDVTSGNNGFYAAGAGYDNATGWGSFKGSAIINAASAVTTSTTLATPTPDIFAYPNPWDVRKHQGLSVIFKNVPANGTIKIFTLSGFWIRTLTGNGLVPWDLKNDSGENVASGLYLYLVNGDGISNTRGKIAVIR